MLSVIEARVLGCLLEKERTTPDQYPLTMSALVSACNQSTSREPVMALEPYDVDIAITSLKAAGLARLVHPSHGRSVTRFRQVADEHHAWTPAQTAVIAVLLLRGPQTLAEIRARTERQHAFASNDDVESTLHELAARPEAQVALLGRAPGEREARWQQLLAEEIEAGPRPAPSTGSSGGGSAAAMADRVAELEARVARLEAALADLIE